MHKKIKSKLMKRIIIVYFYLIEIQKAIQLKIFDTLAIRLI